MMLCVTARADCIIQLNTPVLPDYSATQASVGSLSFDVLCSGDPISYQMQLQTSNGAFQGLDYQGLLSSGSRTLFYSIYNVLPDLGAGVAPSPTVFNSSRHFAYTIEIPAGQWQPTAGVYQATLTLNLMVQ
ncbi:hypothetical protein DC3_41740 [Deinococcus cellulosilyticus NBRC 106333 = KACC 11606]|uniref:Spore coat protein U domain-containing protein n=2 Tax=Deinococcus cellulosilyticus TaxID=401558 RepID=A0A511N6S3_DEIC1|nr:hypothetical protein DC3_41740 [Deinococcus cellulosilyticus NBRC 106333 = KACC 11606]